MEWIIFKTILKEMVCFFRKNNTKKDEKYFFQYQHWQDIEKGSCKNINKSSTKAMYHIYEYKLNSFEKNLIKYWH
jgi:hypothetical protein